MWRRLNKILEDFKRFPLFKLLYKLPGAQKLYHFSLAFAGAVLCGFPSRKIFVIGVTGTKGKTTTVELLSAILEEAHKKTAFLSSAHIKIDATIEKNQYGNTMPGRFLLQDFLKRAVRSKCQYAIVEVASEGVKLSRHRFIKWGAAVFTNIAPEHIESHGSFEAYRDAKISFLRYAADLGGKVFLNADGEYLDFFSGALRGMRLIFYSKKDIEPIVAGFPLDTIHKSRHQFILSDFNKENIAAAHSVARSFGIEEKIIESTVRHFKGVKGRMEFVQTEPFAAIVDYAHTPDSLRAAYKSLKSEYGRLICVLGSAGGGRDKWKRPEMGKAAEEFCDEIILTNEDPYDEDPSQILKEIRSGIHNQNLRVHEILNRKEALKHAISLAEEGDVVIATGKGSEVWIHEANGTKIPWDERKVIEEGLDNL